MSAVYVGSAAVGLVGAWAGGENAREANKNRGGAGGGKYAARTGAIGDEALDWFNKNFTDTQGNRDFTNDLATGTAIRQANLSNATSGVLQDKFLPLDASIVDTAMNYDTQGRRDSMSAQAMADVDSGASVARDAFLRDSAARGIDPNSGNFIASMGVLGNQNAAQRAAAGNFARLQTENTGNAMKMQAANLGVGIGGLQLGQTQSALTAANMPNVVNNAAAGVMNTGFATGMAGNTNAGNILNGQYATTAGADTAQARLDNENNRAIGSAAGTFTQQALDAYRKNNTTTNTNSGNIEGGQ